jgi:hypothetical protein
MPTRLTIRQTVLDNNSHGKFDDGVGVVRAGGGDVGNIHSEVFLAVFASMNGKMQFEFDGTTCSAIPKIMQFSLTGTSSRRAATTSRTRSGLTISCPRFVMGGGQFLDIADSFRGIGHVFSGTWHGDFLLDC